MITFVRMLAAAALLLLAAVPANAGAAFGIANFDGSTSDAEGQPFTEAGGHPSSTMTTFTLNSVGSLPDGAPKDAIVDLPPGFLGNPNAVPQCEQVQLEEERCPSNTQLGVLDLVASGIPSSNPLFNMVPPPGHPAAFGTLVFGVPVLLFASIRNGDDYGVTITSPDISQGIAITDTRVTIWGDPSAPEHNDQRGKSENGTFCTQEEFCDNPFVGPSEPMLRNPTACTGPLTTTLRIDSWDAPGQFDTLSFLSHDNAEPPNPIGIEGCEVVPFEPSISVEPTNPEADSPTGLTVGIHLPQPGLRNAKGIGSADLKRAVVQLPEGVAVSSSSADGLGSCAEDQFGLKSSAPAACPASSSVGSVEIETPLLDNPLRGKVYLAKQGDNPFGSLMALYVFAADEESGVEIKLAGEVKTDPVTGQITTVFDDNPQLPFEDMRLGFSAGPRAALIAPISCGTYTATATLTPWSGTAPVTSTDAFSVDRGPGGGPCPQGKFDPKLEAGTTNPVAGAHGPFVMRLTRADGTQQLSGVDATLPKGLIGKLKGIPYCPDSALAGVSGAAGTAAAQVATPSCPAASQVGRVTVGAGPGPTPFYVDTGRAYLAGPYKGAPLSIAFVTPALAGPFDLGSTLVRAALRVDPRTAAVSVASDPLPRILHGIPLDLRDVRIEIDRDGFMLNPTSCEEMAIGTTVTSTMGASARLSERFQVAGCERLKLKPKLGLRFSGAPPRRGGYPKVTATLRMPAGGANIAKAVVTMPETAFLENAHIRTICTRVQYAANACPKGSIYGYAKAWTPLLDKPLQGPVYLRSSNNTLPDLVADLNGQIEIDLAGRIDSVNERLRATFGSVPDAPVSKFVLTMQGGRKGLLVNNTNICRAAPRASVRFIGHNGKAARSNPAVKVAGCGK